MKRSRVFLGLTAACLAIAGVVAAKASHFDGVQRLYITTGGACVLQPGVAPCVYSPFGSFFCVTILLEGPCFLYTQVNPVGVCKNPVTYDIYE